MATESPQFVPENKEDTLNVLATRQREQLRGQSDVAWQRIQKEWPEIKTPTDFAKLRATDLLVKPQNVLGSVFLSSTAGEIVEHPESGQVYKVDFRGNKYAEKAIGAGHLLPPEARCIEIKDHNGESKGVGIRRSGPPRGVGYFDVVRGNYIPIFSGDTVRIVSDPAAEVVSVQQVAKAQGAPDTDWMQTALTYNADWTQLSNPEQTTIREEEQKGMQEYLEKLRTLELRDAAWEFLEATFHDSSAPADMKGRMEFVQRTLQNRLQKNSNDQLALLAQQLWHPLQRLDLTDPNIQKLLEQSAQPSGMRLANVEWLARLADQLQDDPEITALLGQFDMQKYKQAIAEHESRDSYTARNDREGRRRGIPVGKWAFGKYQFTVETLQGYGIDVTTNDQLDEEKLGNWLNNPELQEAVMERFTLDNLVQILKIPAWLARTRADQPLLYELAARAHIGGVGSVNQPARSDWLGTGVGTYARWVRQKTQGTA